MTSDFRVSSDFFGHHKTVRLQSRFGLEGIVALMRMWAWAAKYRTNGSLDGLTDREIEALVGWRDESANFVRVLGELNWLDGDENARVIHDWNEHQPWLIGAKIREEKSRFGGLVKKYGRDKAKKLMKKPQSARSSARTMPGAVLELDLGNARSSAPPQTRPDQTRPTNPKEEAGTDKALSTSSTAVVGLNGSAGEYAKRVFDHWKIVCKHPAAKLDSRREKLIKARLHDGYTPEQLCQAIDGVLNSPHHMGENDRNTVYDDIALICRDAEHIDKFIRLSSVSSDLRRLGSKGRQAVGALQEWLGKPADGGGHA